MTIPFTFRQLGYFVAVAQHGSISKAAEALHVSQPSVSIAITQLEGLLGQPLFQRHRGQGVSLSPKGEVLFKEARHILTLSHNLLDSQHQHDTEVEGQLVIGCFRDIAPYYLPRLVSEFERRYPRIRVIMQEQDLAGVRKGLEQGKAELVLSYGLGLPPECELHVLDELRPYALLPASHALAGQAQLSLAELAEDMLILQDLPLTREYFLSLFWHRDLQPARIHHTLSFEMQRGLVAHGHGVALSCTRPAGDQSYDGAPIACVPLSDDVPPQRVVLARSADFPLSLPARLFLEQVTGAAPRSGQG
ncbi:LysR substrate-binding domain-containing protein [Oceanimonas sp. CHS3-5]|uniref:LysR substrate-binding domain-containing protein n=1 Tax=Oceanimonas sp. CHS3-5 TaxID=3068186 RepID=UPI00273D9109|nr:LysR substrate-binding domain-containing protein [Oceanimonas sp. CHS3-5]MDP5292359.1 LysR substrate-binding domain-containing protein [Oceanimonas sp. CHS3-5]